MYWANFSLFIIVIAINILRNLCHIHLFHGYSVKMKDVMKVKVCLRYISCCWDALNLTCSFILYFVSPFAIFLELLFALNSQDRVKCWRSRPSKMAAFTGNYSALLVLFLPQILELILATQGQQDRCLLPKEIGPCFASKLRFHFNPENQRCEAFKYGGCQGNGNNFESLQGKY